MLVLLSSLHTHSDGGLSFLSTVFASLALASPLLPLTQYSVVVKLCLSPRRHLGLPAASLFLFVVDQIKGISGT